MGFGLLNKDLNTILHSEKAPILWCFHFLTDKGFLPQPWNLDDFFLNFSDQNIFIKLNSKSFWVFRLYVTQSISNYYCLIEHWVLANSGQFSIYFYKGKVVGLSLIKAILGKCFSTFLGKYFLYIATKSVGTFLQKYLHNDSVQSIESSVVIKPPRSINEIFKLGWLERVKRF